jgi:hypothetical protein
MLPATATTRQPSVMECWISMAHPPVMAGCPPGLPTTTAVPTLALAGAGRR